jgi:uncharacterized protein (TIGR02246 family)
MTDLAESAARAFVRAINRQDADAVAELMTPDHKFIDSMGKAVEGRDRMREAWAKYFRMVPDYRVAIDEVVTDGPLVVMLGVAEGTYAPHGELKPENRMAGLLR